jgi:hypothetical protein
MRFRGLNKLEGKFPEELIQRMDGYLSEVRQRPRGFEEHVVPSLMAKRLNIPEAQALTMLYIADQAGVVNPIFRLYSPEDLNEPIGEYKSLKEVPNEIRRPETDALESLGKEDLLVDLVFKFVE